MCSCSYNSTKIFFYRPFENWDDGESVNGCFRNQIKRRKLERIGYIQSPNVYLMDLIIIFASTRLRMEINVFTDIRSWIQSGEHYMSHVGLVLLGRTKQ